MIADLDLPEEHTRVLRLLIEKISPAAWTWALTGSASLRLQGIDVPVNDLDLQTDAQTIYVIERRLAGFMRTPVHVWESEHTLSHHGQAEIHGLCVELLGDVRHRSPEGDWEPAVDVSSTCIWLGWLAFQVPVFTLEHEARAYEKMGRMERTELIRAAIKRETP
jgi:hypothetical protein